MSVDELEARIARLEDLEEIKKLQSQYVHLLFRQEYQLIVERIFAQEDPDVSIEASDSGVFKGREGIGRFFLQAMASEKETPGFFTMHMAVNPVIEVAKDGKKAKAIWFSPGATAKTAARWAWGKFKVDYVKEHGQWRILHSIFLPFFRTSYEKGWWEEPIAGSLASFPVKPDAPPTLYNPYNRDRADQFEKDPGLPEPY